MFTLKDLDEGIKLLTLLLSQVEKKINQQELYSHDHMRERANYIDVLNLLVEKKKKLSAEEKEEKENIENKYKEGGYYWIKYIPAGSRDASNWEPAQAIYSLGRKKWKFFNIWNINPLFEEDLLFVGDEILHT